MVEILKYNDDDLRDDEIYLALIGTFEADVRRKWVPFYAFNICLLDGTRVGLCNLKIDNSELTKYCGNIGYEVDEEYRGNKYSLKASKLLLNLAKKHNLEYVAINCEPDNLASNKICQLLDAKYTETIDIPSDNEMYKEGKRQMNIYKIVIDY